MREHFAALARVHEWSQKIHGPSARHEWCMAVARAILSGDPIPAAPGRCMPGTAQNSIDTIRRLLDEQPARKESA